MEKGRGYFAETIFEKIGSMNSIEFVRSIYPESFCSQSDMTGFYIICSDRAFYHTLSGYWCIEPDAWRDAEERIQRGMLEKFES